MVEDWEDDMPDMPELVLAPQPVEAAREGDVDQAQAQRQVFEGLQDVWDQNQAVADVGIEFTDAALEEAWHYVQQGHYDWRTLVAVMERWHRNRGADHDWEPMVPWLSRWRRNRKAGRWITNDGPPGDDNFRLLMLKKARAMVSVALQTDDVPLTPPVERVPDMFHTSDALQGPIYLSYERRASKGKYMLRRPSQNDPEVMGLEAFFNLLRLDSKDFESFNLYIELYRTFFCGLLIILRKKAFPREVSMARILYSSAMVVGCGELGMMREMA